MLIVNARLPFISVDVWYRGLLNNTAVLTIGTNTASLLTTAARLRLTTNNRDRTRQQDIQAEDATILHKEQIRPKIDLIYSTI